MLAPSYSQPHAAALSRVLPNLKASTVDWAFIEPLDTAHHPAASRRGSLGRPFERRNGAGDSSAKPDRRRSGTERGRSDDDAGDHSVGDVGPGSRSEVRVPVVEWLEDAGNDRDVGSAPTPRRRRPAPGSTPVPPGWCWTWPVSRSRSGRSTGRHAIRLAAGTCPVIAGVQMKGGGGHHDSPSPHLESGNNTRGISGERRTPVQ